MTGQDLAEQYARTPADQPAERKRLAGLAVEAYRGRVAGVVRALLPRRPDAWADAEQSGIVGLLWALSTYRPGAAAFWTYAYWKVVDEIRRYRANGVHWQPDLPRGGRASDEQRETYAARSSGVESYDDEQSTSETFNPEELVALKQEHSRVGEIVHSLTRGEQQILATGGTAHYKQIVDKVRTLFGGKS